ICVQPPPLSRRFHPTRVGQRARRGRKKSTASIAMRRRNGRILPTREDFCREPAYSNGQNSRPPRASLRKGLGTTVRATPGPRRYRRRQKGALHLSKETAVALDYPCA